MSKEFPIRSFLFAAVCCLMVTAVSAAELRPVKYVFLFIGDGMSIPQRMMAEGYLKKLNQPGLHINTMPQQAITTTNSANSFITDSAASGTAIACGAKTNNGALGVTPDGQRLESIAEVAHKSGKKVGVISSVTLNHATPAAFYAHQASRGSNYEIGLDLIASGFDYFGGGGIASHAGKAEKNQTDIFDLAQQAGYTVCRDEASIRALKRGSGKVLAIGSETDLPYALDVPEGGLRLADFTRQAIELLDNPKGFFMMVEGGKIDWMCHANDAATTFGEIIEFDNAVKEAFAFAKKHPSDTLIVVTGDHETGGLTLGFANTGYESYIDLIQHQKISRDAFETYFKQLAEDSSGTPFENVKTWITEKSGLQFTEDGQWKHGTMSLTKPEQEELAQKYADKKYRELTSAIIRLVNNKAGLAWTSGAHTALPVNTTAWGKESNAFFGMIDNTDIAKKLKQTVVVQDRPVRRVFRR
jgi:alkaline phosphatase